MSDEQIPRGADLTNEDLALIADDVMTVTWWCMRNRIKRPDQAEQVKRTIEARLGRRPLVITNHVPPAQNANFKRVQVIGKINE
jgi:hypothetical protein